MVRNYTDKELLDRVQELDTFKVIPKGRWILGVRSKADLTDKFDDKFYEYEGNKFIRVLTGTTHPAKSILLGGYKKYNRFGAAVVRANKWYYNLWKYGLHKGKMPALLQVGAKIDVYRDGDNDSKSEELGAPIAGWYGINYHTNTYDFSDASLKMKLADIKGWSAGCQVPNDRAKYVEQIEWYKDAWQTGKQEFVTYCLIDEF